MHNLIILLALLGSAAALSIHAADKPRETLCYELRTYYAAPGKLDALNARFRKGVRHRTREAVSQRLQGLCLHPDNIFANIFHGR